MTDFLFFFFEWWLLLNRAVDLFDDVIFVLASLDHIFVVQLCKWNILVGGIDAGLQSRLDILRHLDILDILKIHIRIW